MTNLQPEMHFLLEMDTFFYIILALSATYDYIANTNLMSYIFSSKPSVAHVLEQEGSVRRHFSRTDFNPDSALICKLHILFSLKGFCVVMLDIIFSAEYQRPTYSFFFNLIQLFDKNYVLNGTQCFMRHCVRNIMSLMTWLLSFEDSKTSIWCMFRCDNGGCLGRDGACKDICYCYGVSISGYLFIAIICSYNM